MGSPPLQRDHRKLVLRQAMLPPGGHRLPKLSEVSASWGGGKGGCASPRDPERLPLGMQRTRDLGSEWTRDPEETDTHTQMWRMVSSGLGRPDGGLCSPRAHAVPVPWIEVVRDPQSHLSSLAWTHCCQEVLMTFQISHPRCPLFPQTPREGVREACWSPERPMASLPAPAAPGGHRERGHCGCLGLFTGGSPRQGGPSSL